MESLSRFPTHLAVPARCVHYNETLKKKVSAKFPTFKWNDNKTFAQRVLLFMKERY